jgi:hypothetical protein
VYNIITHDAESSLELKYGKINRLIYCTYEDSQVMENKVSVVVE